MTLKHYAKGPSSAFGTFSRKREKEIKMDSRLRGNDEQMQKGERWIPAFAGMTAKGDGGKVNP